MADKKTKEDIEKLSFEDAIKKLKVIVDRIEQGEIPLQDSLEQYEQGMLLIRHCRDVLQKAEKRIEKISQEPMGGSKPVQEDPSDPDSEEDEGLF